MWKITGLHQIVTWNILNQKFGEVKSQWGLLSDVQLDVWSSTPLGVFFVLNDVDGLCGFQWIHFSSTSSC